MSDQSASINEQLDDDVIDARLRGAAVAAMPNGIRQPKRRAFLAAYARCGNVSEAARIAGCNRLSHYEWLRTDERYAEVFEQAHEIAIDYLEAVARQRATDGWLEPVFYHGEVVGHVRKFSDTLLIFLMKGARPDTYRDNATIRHTGADGGAIKVEAEYELSRRIMDRPDLLAAAELLAAELYQTAPAGELDAGAPIPVESEEVDDGE
jgi:hypothetical protein